jgi:catechol 2,3-dioxygenase-like lactoylglutathione lyase family enzyme
MKPGKFHRYAPHLPVKNLRETLDYYRDVLGFYEEWTYGDRDGGIKGMI